MFIWFLNFQTKQFLKNLYRSAFIKQFNAKQLDALFIINFLAALEKLC